MSRSEKVSQYITDNIRDPDVIKKANEKFEFNDKEIKAMKVIAASLIPMQTQLMVMDSWLDFAKDGMGMIRDAKKKHERIRNQTGH